MPGAHGQDDNLRRGHHRHCEGEMGEGEGRGEGYLLGFVVLAVLSFSFQYRVVSDFLVR